MKHAASKRIIYLTPQQMNQLLNEVRHKIRYYVDYDYAKEQDGATQNISGPNVYICDKDVKFVLTTCYKGTNATFITFKDGRDIIDEVSGARVFATFSQYWKVPKVEVEDLSATPILGFNPDYNEQRLDNCYGYDLNSAYSAAMLRGWIDTSKPPQIKRIDPEKEVGFEVDDEGVLRIKRFGFCNVVFPKMDVPDGVRRYVLHYYSIKKNAKTKEEKINAKRYLNYIVGFFQRVNPWLRAWVVCSCNEMIEELLDENSLFWNTDSIVSRVRRPDLEADVGLGIGQWKIEHEGTIAYRGLAYQWNHDKPTYRGVVKSWFPDDYDILRDDLPKCGNDWQFNKKTFQLEATKWQKLDNINNL